MLKRLIAALVGICLGLPVAMAVPANPFPITYTQPDGSTLQVQIVGDEYGSVYKSLDGALLFREDNGRLRTATDLEAAEMTAAFNGRREGSSPLLAPAKGPGKHGSTFRSYGDVKACVILVQFSDVKFNDQTGAQRYFDRWCNEERFTLDGNVGSVRDYFLASSDNNFRPHFDVYGPVTLSGSVSSYTESGTGSSKMIKEACSALDSSVDFSQYDVNGDGEVDNIAIIFAGRGGNDVGRGNAPWPHGSDVGSFTTKPRHDGKTINHYCILAERNADNSKPAGIGVFVHEFGHVLGLPDLYTSNYDEWTPGWWNIMDVGNYWNDCRSPVLYSAYERYALDWITPTELTQASKVNLRPLIDNNFACIIQTGRSGDFYLLETRYKKYGTFDNYLPADGMLIWHIDASNSSNFATGTKPNAQYGHMCVDLVEADNTYGYGSYAGDVWPGSANNTSFTGTSSPNMFRWNSSSTSSAEKTIITDKPLTNIQYNSNTHTVSFNFKGGSSSVLVDPTPPQLVNFKVEADTPEMGDVSIGTEGSGVTEFTAESDTYIKLFATPKSNKYVFQNWTRDGVIVSTSRWLSYLVDPAKNGGTYIAHFHENKDAVDETYHFKVEASPAEAGTVSLDYVNSGKTEGDYPVGGNVSLYASAKSGTNYKFLRWEYNGNTVSTSQLYQPVSNAAHAGTYTAIFEQVVTSNLKTIRISTQSTYMGNVHLDYPGSGKTEGEYEAGTKIMFYAVPNEGFKFDHWVLSTNQALPSQYGNAYVAECEFLVPTTAVEMKNLGLDKTTGTIKANFATDYTEKAEYEFHAIVDENGGGTVYIDTEGQTTAKVKETKSAKFCAVPDENYIFDRWTDEEGNFKTTSSTLYVTSSAETAGTYVAHFLYNGPTHLSYLFTVQSADETMGTVCIGEPNSKNKTLEINDGEEVAIYAYPKRNYSFDQWTRDEVWVSSAAEYSFSSGSSTKGTYTANFVYDPVYEFEVEASPKNGGTVSIGSPESGVTKADVKHDTDALLYATPAKHYKFVRWAFGGTTVSEEAEYRVESSEKNQGKYIAVFEYVEPEKYEFTVETSSTEGGSVSIGTADSGETTAEISDGDEVTMIATPAEGYCLQCWLHDSEIVGTSNELTLTCEEALSGTYTADFHRCHHIKLTQSEHGHVWIGDDRDSDEQHVWAAEVQEFKGRRVEAEADGSTITLHAEPEEGYQFSFWKRNGQAVNNAFENYTIPQADASNAGEYKAVFVGLGEVTDMNILQGEQTEIMYFDTLGRRVYLPQPGCIYIRVQPGRRDLIVY